MQQKISLVYDHIQRGETDCALKLIENINKKDSKKQKLSEEGFNLLQLLKCICLVRNIEFGEAKNIFENFIRDNNGQYVQDYDQYGKLEYIANQLNLQRDLSDDYNKIVQKLKLPDELLLKQLQLNIAAYNFQQAFPLALSMFKSTNDQKYMLQYIYLQYLSAVQTDNKKSFSLPYMFLQKFQKELKLLQNGSLQLDQNDETRKMQIFTTKLELQILMRLEQYDKVLSQLDVYMDIFINQYQYLDIVRQIYSKTNQQDLRLKFVNLNLKVFQKNLNLDQFIMNFDVSKQFIEFVFQEFKNFNSIQMELSQSIKFEQIDSLESDEDFINLMKLIYGSIKNSQIVIKSYEKHENQLKALKNAYHCEFLFLSLCLERTKSTFYAKEFSLVLKSYQEHFGATLTFYDEIMTYVNQFSEESFEEFKKYFQSLDQNIIDQEQNQVKKIVRTINNIKFNFLYLEHQSIDENEFICDQVKNYIQSLSSLHLDSSIEKGERTYADEFIVLLTDLTLNKLHRKPKLDNLTYTLLIQLLLLLEIGHQRSPYNYDFKLRIIKISQLLVLPDIIYQYLKEMDIKSVQMETLGFLFMKNEIEYNLNNQWNTQIKGLSFYIENCRESKENLKSSLKNQNLEIFQEFWDYDAWIQKSYIKDIYGLIHLQVNLKKNQSNLNVKYLIEQIDANIQSNDFTWNVDVKIMQPCFQFHKQDQFYWNYIGIYNNQIMLKIQLTRCKMIHKMQNQNDYGDELVEIQKQHLEQLKQVNYHDYSVFKHRKKPQNLMKIECPDELEWNDLQLQLKLESMFIQFETELFQVKNYEVKSYEFVQNLQKQLFVQINDVLGSFKDQEIFQCSYYKIIQRFLSNFLFFIELYFKNDSQNKVDNELNSFQKILKMQILEILDQINEVSIFKQAFYTEKYAQIFDQICLSNGFANIIDNLAKVQQLNTRNVVASIKNNLTANYIQIFAGLIADCKEAKKVIMKFK